MKEQGNPKDGTGDGDAVPSPKTIGQIPSRGCIVGKATIQTDRTTENDDLTQNNATSHLSYRSGVEDDAVTWPRLPGRPWRWGRGKMDIPGACVHEQTRN